ncbi:unnamed protein product [Brachionus calyciflorus]|uniref:GDP-fucose pyrophosphorylase domain-containing protein n=1 Tax=Brachionus calyciflorus TaxID=104777 RepID=A0A813M138_9BILA|nr:unnamed protein product [Brachionus calyciflorus]
MLKNLKLFLNDETIGEFAYTDSVFFFSHQITDKFLKFYEEHFKKIKSHKIEVDGYRDFLQPLGTNPLSISDFLVSTKYSNETQEKIYTSLYHLINKKSSKILAMTNSDFYHLGTVNEVMNYYFDTNDNVSIKFRNELCFEKIKKSNFYQDKNFNTEGCLIYSYAGLKCKIGLNSILEYCYFGDNISLTTGNYTFLNNCMVNNYDGRHLKIPDNVCIHTIPVNLKKPNGDFEIKYVTIFFNRNDDLKKNYKDLSKMFFLENQLGDNLSAIVSCLNGNSIWNLKIFRACDTMSTSFLCSYNFIENFIKFKLDAIIEFLTTDKEDLFSLFDLLEHNSYEKMIEYRLEYGLI